MHHLIFIFIGCVFAMPWLKLLVFSIFLVSNSFSNSLFFNSSR